MIDEIEKLELQHLKEGSEASFEFLFHRYSPKLYHFVYRLSSGNEYISEEIVQRSFIKVWETKKTIDVDKSFVSYLCTIAKNMLLNNYEHQMVEYIYQNYVLKYNTDHENTTSDIAEAHLLDEYIDKQTESLPPARKRIFILYRKEQLSVKEIAVKLGLSESTVQNQLTKALSFIRADLAQYYKEILILMCLNFC
jgi:RNA polymerase sigma-70 factor (family 1)